MFKSLGARLWLTYALVTAVMLLLVAAGIVFYLLGNPLEVRQANLRLGAAADALSQRDRLPLNDLEQSQTLVERSAELMGVRVLIVRADGIILADSESGAGGPLFLENTHMPRGQGNGAGMRTLVDGNGQRWLYTVRLLPGSETLYLVTAAPRPRATVGGILQDDLFRPVMQAGAIALTLSLLFAVWISRWVAGPLERMATSARAMAEGHYQPVALEGPSEVQALGRSFNEMAGRVVASQQSQRDFVANVSHELKTPLTSVQGFAQAILDGTARNPEALTKAAHIIHDEAGRMHRLVLDLLELARLDAGTAGLEIYEVDLGGVLRGVAERFAPQSQAAGVELVMDVPALPRLQGDGDRLAQVFNNLVDNAIKHSPAGGEVRLTAGEKGGMLVVEVRDGGAGIPTEELGRIFERFYQVDKARRGGGTRGVGLGLAIAYEIVQAHGGTLTASSTAGAGSVFTVRLPVKK